MGFASPVCAYACFCIGTQLRCSALVWCKPPGLGMQLQLLQVPGPASPAAGCWLEAQQYTVHVEVQLRTEGSSHGASHGACYAGDRSSSYGAVRLVQPNELFSEVVLTRRSRVASLMAVPPAVAHALLLQSACWLPDAPCLLHWHMPWVQMRVHACMRPV